jgi:cell wall-associated NlpC family hydrolase
VEFDLLVSLLNAADQVQAEVEGAANAMDAKARQIDGSVPTVPRGYDYNNGGMPAATNAYRPPAASKASYRITDPNDPVGRALSVASGELGTRETDAAFAGKPYNNGSAWCAAFTSWVWKEAGYDVTWTDFDYVPAVWNDAAALGLQKSTAEAQPGDLIVFDWEGDGTPDHIGIVESVSGGKIHTIEGNSSDQVAKRDYGINSGEVVGVIKPPPTGSDRV